MISTMKKPFDFTRWSLRISLFALLAAGFAVFGLRFSIIDFQPALLGIAGTTLTGLLAIVFGLIGTLRAIKAKETNIVSTLAGAILGLLVVMPVLMAIMTGAGAPRIHDITTDLTHPPEFVAIQALRAPAHNSLDRLEPENLAALQKAGYPDLAPLFIPRPSDQVFEQAVTLVKKRGWEVAAVSAANGRIEATDTTRIMGFKDDVVIRVQAAGNKTQVDMRSASRVGKGDLGMNAKRIRLFLADLGE